MAAQNLTKTANIGVTAREIDFVTRFNNNWDHLREIIGISRPIKKQPGAILRSKVGSVTLQNSVNEGESIPYSLASVVERTYQEMTIEKYAKAVSIEAIKDHGYDNAIALTDDAFLTELQDLVTGRFYTFLNSGALATVETTWQKALAMAKGYVVNKFKSIHKTATDVVGFVNVLDLYEYLGTAEITVQSDFGFQYVKNFMGYRVVFLLSDSEIASGRVIATPVENISMYYIDPGDSDFTKAGLEYTTVGDTSLIGFHTQGNYGTAVSECFAILGLSLFAEYIDGIAVVDVQSSTSLGSLTVTSAEGTASGKTKLTVSPDLASAAHKYFYKAASGTAPSVAFKEDVSTWTSWDGTSELAITDGHKVTVVEADGLNRALKSGNATADTKA